MPSASPTHILVDIQFKDLIIPSIIDNSMMVDLSDINVANLASKSYKENHISSYRIYESGYKQAIKDLLQSK